MQIKGKKVLLMGLGILGGGVATARKLFELGADLTITDMKTEEYLKPSLEKLSDFRDIKFVLGEHREEDFLNNEIIVVNPDVPTDNKFVKLAKENGKKIENELSLFFKICKSKNTVGITGTRGKTTTVNWTAHLLEASIVGNSPDNPFLGKKVDSQDNEKLVLEIPSFQLELLNEYVDKEDSKLSPHIAVITNLYRDHINRHKSMEGYALAKSNIFKSQDENDYLILNKDNEWTQFFLDQKPKSKVILFSKEDTFDFIDKDEFVEKWGEHNLANLVVAIHIAKILGVTDSLIKDRIETLPQIKFRQEKVFDNGEIEVYNDTSATSPDATIAAVNRFKASQNLILISGGTDKELEFAGFAKEIKNMVKPENLILLSGSATEKAKNELGWDTYNEFDTLEECFKESLLKAQEKRSIILFSPASKSFEKFKNEFDRGEKFNELVKKLT